MGPLPNGLNGLYVAVTILSGMALQEDSLNHACWKDTFIFDKVTEVNFVEISADKVRKNVQQFLHTYLLLGRLHHAIQIKMILNHLSYNNNEIHVTKLSRRGSVGIVLKIWWSYRNYWHAFLKPQCILTAF